ncbi:NapC/NirT family cytochrome c [Spartinivicinus ruber]|uniref:NapC/NirT family cytochrome c n=1 Tax=Spartinivicinus ruber TaxID=2683272 RepID=UPI0013D72375|nr:NapC/NirT family cytochrome c [Spartinivicinus ruber]
MAWVKGNLFKYVFSMSAIIGVLVGMMSMLALEKVDQLTSTDNFCSNSCHPMTRFVANKPFFIQSSHRATSSGVQASCADCHIPKGLLPATWAHITDGSRDLWSLLINDFSSEEQWNAARPEMAYRVRDWLLENDSHTCRSCHVTVKPSRERGQRQHKLAERNGVTCIGCHFNLVHDEVKPRESFLRQVKIDNKL